MSIFANRITIRMKLLKSIVLKWLHCHQFRLAACIPTLQMSSRWSKFDRNFKKALNRGSENTQMRQNLNVSICFPETEFQNSVRNWFPPFGCHTQFSYDRKSPYCILKPRFPVIPEYLVDFLSLTEIDWFEASSLFQKYPHWRVFMHFPQFSRNRKSSYWNSKEHCNQFPVSGSSPVPEIVILESRKRHSEFQNSTVHRFSE